MGRLDLQDDLFARGRERRCDDRGNAALERLAKRDAPLLDQAGVGQR
jgi:hypothetical protein